MRIEYDEGLFSRVKEQVIQNLLLENQKSTTKRENLQQTSFYKEWEKGKTAFQNKHYDNAIDHFIHALNVDAKGPIALHHPHLVKSLIVALYAQQATFGSEPIKLGGDTLHRWLPLTKTPQSIEDLMKHTNPQDLIIHYEKGHLGIGGFGIVYRGEYKKNPVAVKIVKIDKMIDDDEKAKRKIEEEINLLLKFRGYPTLMSIKESS